MRSGSIAALPGKRVARLLALLGAYLFALQSLGLPLLTADAPAASCCCAHADKSAHCRCKVCTHARELESDLPLLGECGPGGEKAVTLSVDPFHPPLLPLLASAPLFALPLREPSSLLSQSILEVATPPPLARA